MKISIYFLLFSISVAAQSPNIAYQRIVKEINTLLYQTKKVQFLNPDNDAYNLRKIESSPKGNVMLIDSLNNKDSRANYKMFSLLEVKEFVGKENEIQVIDKHDQKIGAFINVEIQDWYEFIKNLRALQHICNMYAEEDPKYKCTEKF